MIPIGDEPRDPTHIPWATIGLILASVLVGAFTLPLAGTPAPADSFAGLSPDFDASSALDDLLFRFGFRPLVPSLTTAATAMFLHGSVLHLLGNMLYLWIYGPNVERRLGSVPFVLLYGTAGVLAALLYALVSLGSPIPMIGASGAISGVLGAYLVFFPTNAIRFFVFVTTIRLPAWLVLLAYIGVDNLLPFAIGADAGTAHAAHIGGFFGGFVLAAGLRVVQPVEAPRPRARGAEEQLARALALCRQGMLLDAHRLLAELAAATGEEAHAARTQLLALESDPRFLRAAGRGPRP